MLSGAGTSVHKVFRLSSHRSSKGVVAPSENSLISHSFLKLTSNHHHHKLFRMNYRSSPRLTLVQPQKPHSKAELEREALFYSDAPLPQVNTGTRHLSEASKFVNAANSIAMAHYVLKTKAPEKPRQQSTFQKNVIQNFKLHLNLCCSIGSTSFCWDEERNEFASQRNILRRIQFYVQMGVAVIHNIFLLWNLACGDVARFGVAYKMLAIYFTTGYCLCNGLKLFAWLHESEIVKLMNANFNLEGDIRVNGKKTNSNGDRSYARTLKSSEQSQKALISLGIITGIAVPTLVFLILLANPCQPPFIGSIVFDYTEEHHCNVSSWSLHLIITIINGLMHLDMVLPMVFTMFSLFFLSVSCLHDYIEHLKRKVMDLAKGDYTGENLYFYRKLQIIEKQLNACFRQQYFPLLLSGMTALLIFCLYSCIRLHDKIPMPGFSYFPLVALDGIVSLLVMNTKAANVLEHSANLVEMFKNDVALPRRHWVKKMSWSLTPLKINFMMNFVDKSTPLIFINFSLNQVVSLLLVGSGRGGGGAGAEDLQFEEVLAN